MEVKSEYFLKQRVHKQRIQRVLNVTMLQCDVLLDFKYSIRSIGQVAKRFNLDEDQTKQIKQFMELSNHVTVHKDMIQHVVRGTKENCYSLSESARELIANVPLPSIKDGDYVRAYYDEHKKGGEQ